MEAHRNQLASRAEGFNSHRSDLLAQLMRALKVLLDFGVVVAVDEVVEWSLAKVEAAAS